MYVVCGSRLPASSTSSNHYNHHQNQSAQQTTSKKKRHHSTSSAGAGSAAASGGQAMPFAATVKAQMLRLLRRTKSTRSAMVIPNKRYSVLVPESPSAVIVEPLPPAAMALGTTTTPGSASVVPPEIRRPRHRSHSQVRRHSRQVSGSLPPQQRTFSLSLSLSCVFSSFFCLFLINWFYLTNNKG